MEFRMQGLWARAIPNTSSTGTTVSEALAKKNRNTPALVGSNSVLTARLAVEAVGQKR